MRRLATIALLSIMLFMNSITFTTLGFGQENNLLYDNFEGYNEGSFPSAGGWEIVWDGRGGEYQQVVVWSGDKKFQVWGSRGWSAVIQKSFSSQARHIGYEFDILIDGRGTSGVDHPGFFCRECATWGVYWATVEFDHSSGQIRSGSTILGTWEPNRFYHVKIMLDREAENYSVWIDGVLKAENLPARDGDKPPTTQIKAVALVSQWSGHRVLYDNVRVFEIVQEEAENRVRIVSYNPPSTTNAGAQISFPIVVEYDFSVTSYVGISVAVKNLTGGWSRVWYNPDFSTRRSGSGTLNYMVTFQSPSNVGTYEYMIRGYYWNGEDWVISDVKYFTIVVIQQLDTTPPTVRVLAPNGGETLTVGQTFRIRWEASDNVGVSRIHIWLFQGGSQVAVIATNQPNTGYYDWTVPDRTGIGYKIRIAAVDAAGNAGYDDSDGTFQVQQQPQAGSLTIRIHNVKGLTMPQSGGSLDVSLYKWDSSRNQWMFVSSGGAPYRGGVEYVATSFSNLELNKYYYFEVRHTLASWLRLEEYWGWFRFTLTSGNSSAFVDFYRSRPYITDVNYPDSAASGGSITFSMPVKNEDAQPRALYLTVILDRDLMPPYDVIQNSSAFTLAPGETRAIIMTLTAPEPGTYNPYIVLSFYYPSDPNIHKTVYDQWDGSFKPIEITAQPACNLEIVSVDLADKESGRPLDRRVHVGQDFRIHALVRNSGSSSVCISGSSLNVEWSPRDMLEYHMLYCGIPPEEIGPGQETVVFLCGWLTALKPGIVTIKISVGGCIGHSEREGEVCNCAGDFGPMCEATKYITLEIVPGEVTTVTTTSTITKTETIYAEETAYKTYHTWTTVTRTLWTRTTEYVTTTTTSTATTWTTTTIATTITSGMGPSSALALAFLTAPIAGLIVKVKRRWRR